MIEATKSLPTENVTALVVGNTWVPIERGSLTTEDDGLFGPTFSATLAGKRERIIGSAESLVAMVVTIEG